MKKIITIFKTELLLYLRNFSGFFFTLAFPSIMVLIFGGIYGNEPSSYFNGMGTMDVSIPAYTAMIIGVTGLMDLPLTLGAYKENKVYKRFDATPIGKGRIIAVQTAVCFFMTIVGFLILFAVGKVGYNIKVQGNVLTIAAGMLLSIATVFSIGFFFTAIAPTAKINNLLCNLTYFIMIFLSGSTIPMELFPDTMKNISTFIPLTHAVKLLQGTFRNAPFADYRNNVIVLVCILVVCTVSGAVLYKRKSW